MDRESLAPGYFEARTRPLLAAGEAAVYTAGTSQLQHLAPRLCPRPSSVNPSRTAVSVLVFIPARNCNMTRNCHCRSVLLVLVVLLAGAATGAEPPDVRLRKKLIATGWDHPDSQSLLAHLAEMEKQPFDGVVLELIGRTADGKPCPLRPAFSNQVWQPAWFQTNIDQLRACKCQRFTDNFITVGANPGDVDWFDDAGWRQVVEHWRIAAWIAKQSGCKGILFDPEPYTPPHAQFGYAAQPGRGQHSFNQYAEKARQRGREVMQAVVKEYPNITLFCYFMNSVSAEATGRADPRPALATEGYGLYPAMIDGWLDVAPPSVVLVDGCESAYLFNSRQQFLEAALLMKGACQELVSPENRPKYRAQVQAGFGIYLDAYWTPKGSPWYIDGRGGSRVERCGSTRPTPCPRPTSTSGSTASSSAGGPLPTVACRRKAGPRLFPVAIGPCVSPATHWISPAPSWPS